MGKTKKVKEKKGRIMIDDHVLLSDISDYEYDTLVEKPQSIGTCNNFEKSSSLSVSETSQFPENHHVLYSAVPLYDKRGLSFCTSGINTGQLPRQQSRFLCRLFPRRVSKMFSFLIR